ncbi:MAG: 5-(carboxyamino)imidazole ribonucleotide synthase [Acidimicrobiales bacterium]|nr:5-(carboxyamino)imidazole ribonucleotide synthase [Acidimicrobiales bacterium]
MGIIGGGQLARMIAQAAVSLGVRVSVLAGASDEGVPGVFASVTTGNPDDPEAIAAFAAGVDVVTFDHENVDWAALEEAVASGVAVRPSPDTLRFADKAHQRERLARAGCPVPPFEIVDPAGTGALGSPMAGPSPTEVARRFADTHGPRVIAKASRGGYDGRAVFLLDDADALVEFVVGWTGAPLVLEPALDLAAEVAVVTARRPGGQHATYPVLETIQRDGMCNEVVVPARLDEAVLARARQVGEEVALVAEAVGVIAVELFITTGGAVLVNEIAPRVHNSGHVTSDACLTGQFEQHLRAVLDLPLGDVSLRSPAAMVNVVGAGGPSGEEAPEPRARLAAGMAVDAAAKVHLYAKTPRPERKIGHVTVCDDDADRALARATAVARALDGRDEEAT